MSGAETVWTMGKMVGRVGLEPMTIGLKVLYTVLKRIVNQLVTDIPVSIYARLCTTVHD